MNILHLSDIHFGRNYSRTKIKEAFDNKNKILDELIECVKNIEGLKPEHIIVTGDIAWYGKEDEYDEALIWFKKLLNAVNLTGADITFCVGNHDVNRDYANNFKEIKDESIKEIDEIYHYDHVHEMESTIFDYEIFCEKLGVTPFTYPCNGQRVYSYSIGYKDVTFPSLKTIRLVSFNTALLSFMPKENISQEKMWIGQKQVKALIQYGIIPSKDVYYTIAVFHHAERFLNPDELSEYGGRAATLD